MLERAQKGVYHRLLPKYQQAYVDTFAACQNVRALDTLAPIHHVLAELISSV